MCFFVLSRMTPPLPGPCLRSTAAAGIPHPAMDEPRAGPCGGGPGGGGAGLRGRCAATGRRRHLHPCRAAPSNLLACQCGQVHYLFFDPPTSQIFWKKWSETLSYFANLAKLMSNYVQKPSIQNANTVKTGKMFQFFPPFPV